MNSKGEAGARKKEEEKRKLKKLKNDEYQR